MGGTLERRVLLPLSVALRARRALGMPVVLRGRARETIPATVR